jgi:hypothetical protein
MEESILPAYDSFQYWEDCRDIYIPAQSFPTAASVTGSI